MRSVWIHVHFEMPHPSSPHGSAAGVRLSSNRRMQQYRLPLAALGLFSTAIFYIEQKQFMERLHATLALQVRSQYTSTEIDIFRKGNRSTFQTSFSKHVAVKHEVMMPLRSSLSSMPNSSGCALLFFGLTKQFKNICLPSIRKHILSNNPTCDIFMHTYNKTTIMSARNGEKNSPLKIEEVFLFTEATKIMIETDDDFHRQRNVTAFHKYPPYKNYGWVLPESLDNMIKQWHSISQVWKLMLIHEQSKRLNGHDFQYARVGFIRPDLLYENKINIYDGDAVTVLFNNMPGYMCDRLFYGLRSYAEKWASRFDHVEDYMKTKFGKRFGLHSESYLFHLMGHWKVPMQYKDICAKRVRATGFIITNDCSKRKRPPSWKHDYSLMQSWKPHF